MKFSHQLKYNAVPEWAEHYVAYDQLKKLIYQIEREIVLAQSTSHDPERELLLDAQEHANHIFIPALDREVARITEFYVSKESALYEAANRLLLDIKSTYGDFDEDEEETADDTRRPSLPVQERRRLSIGQQLHQRRASHISVLEPGNTQLTTTSIGSWISDSGQATLPLLREPELREEALQIYVALVDLESYVDLNFTAFNKILKKYDKITRNRLRKSYIQESVLTAYPFYAETKARLKKQIQRVAVAHGVAAQFSDPEENMRFLKQHIRERVIFTRNTVWREMIGQERKVTAIDVQQVGEPVAPKYICGVRVPRLLMTRQVLYGVPSVLVFAYLLHTETLPDVAQNNCFALLVFASLLWAFEILPLFVTSLLVPFLIVLLGVLRDNEGERMPASMAARYIFSSMFNSVIVLLLGGFTIAAALSKYDIAKRMASAVLSHAGTRPSTVLLFSMLVAAFSSMWISNVAAPVLCFSLVQPILRTLPINSPFAPCLIMGIALASNVGGMTSPISSPQNLIALEVMDPSPSWPEWFIIALPVSIAIILIVWLMLLLIYRPTLANSPIQTLRASDDPITKEQIIVSAVTLITIILWCFESQVKSYIGDMGVLALIPVVVFFGSELLTKEDFNNFLWTVVVLAMGGIALGQAVSSSGLLATIADHIRQMVADKSTWMLMLIFTSIVGVAATFVSHTVAALVFLPIVNEVGKTLPGEHARVLVMMAALMCSGAMGLPVSSFPNMNAAMMEDATGKVYLKPIDFLRSGVPASVLALAIIVTLGGGIMYSIGF